MNILSKSCPALGSQTGFVLVFSTLVTIEPGQEDEDDDEDDDDTDDGDTEGRRQAPCPGQEGGEERTTTRRRKRMRQSLVLAMREQRGKEKETSLV